MRAFPEPLPVAAGVIAITKAVEPEGDSSSGEKTQERPSRFRLGRSKFRVKIE